MQFPKMKMLTKCKTLAIISLFSVLGVAMYFNFQRNCVTKRLADFEGPTNVIILSYARVGSSLLGEILSSFSNCSYFFEPLAYVCNFLKKCEGYNAYIEKLLNCDDQLLKEFLNSNYWVSRRLNKPLTRDESLNEKNRLSNYCKNTSIHVVKTIRLRILHAIQLLRHGNIPNLKVVHLMRDPRARYSSLINGKWSNDFFSINTMCEEMESDLLLAKLLPEDVYTLIRYEDLVRNPSKEINAIFNKIYGRNYGNETAEYLRNHMGTKENSTAMYDKKNLTVYYDTFRAFGVDLNQWKTNLPKDKLEEIEQKCDYVLKEMNYSLFNSSQTSKHD